MELQFARRRHSPRQSSVSEHVNMFKRHLLKVRERTDFFND